MSIELVQLYQKLSPSARVQLNETHQKSPKMGLLLALLETQNLHSTSKAVSHIYAAEIEEGIKREVLTNRFYKLREKAKDLFTECFKNTSAGLSEIQKELNFISFLMGEKQFSQASSRLQELEKKCWEQNAFECLPAVYELCMDAVYGVEPFRKDLLEHYYEQKKNALYLRQQLELFCNYMHDFYLHSETFHDLLKQLRERLKTLKQYPRFELIYHYLAIRAGGFTEVVNNNPQSASLRHFNRFREILAQYPQMPILRLEENEQKGIRVKALNAEVLFGYARADKPLMKRAIEQMLELPNLVSFCTERDLFNLCLMTIQSKFFAQARRLLDLLAQFQEMQYAHESDVPWQYFELVWYCKQYPAAQPSNIAQYVQKIVQQIETRSLANTPNPGIWVYGVLVVYALLCGDLATAEKILYMPVCVAYEQKMVLPPDVAVFLELVKTANFAELLEFQNKMLAQSKNKTLKISHRKHYELLGEAAQVVLNQKKNTPIAK